MEKTELIKSIEKAKNIEDLILCGVNITRHSQEGDIIYTKGDDLVSDVFWAYQAWRYKIEDFIYENHLAEKWNILLEADSVARLKGGAGYEDKASPISQKLFKNIREETSKKNIILREIQKNISGSTITKNLKQDICLLKLDENTGEVFLQKNNKKLGTVKVGTLPFQYLKIAISSYPTRVLYDNIANRLNSINQKRKYSEDARQFCHEIKRQLKEQCTAVAKYCDHQMGVRIMKPSKK